MPPGQATGVIEHARVSEIMGALTERFSCQVRTIEVPARNLGDSWVELTANFGLHKVTSEGLNLSATIPTMRCSLIFLSLLATAVSVSAVASPRPAGQPIHQLKQVTRRELEARAKFSKHFFDKREAEPSGEPGPADPCENFPFRRRDLEYDQVLAPWEVVAFLKGRGQFTSENGTAYVDEHFMQALDEGKDLASRWPAAHRVYKRVKTMAGQSLLRISAPHYKRWKKTLTPGDIFWLSSRTYMRHEDVDEVERLLLEDPEFTDVEWKGIHVTRSFLEAALSY